MAPTESVALYLGTIAVAIIILWIMLPYVAA